VIYTAGRKSGLTHATGRPRNVLADGAYASDYRYGPGEMGVGDARVSLAKQDLGGRSTRSPTLGSPQRSGQPAPATSVGDDDLCCSARWIGQAVRVSTDPWPLGAVVDISSASELLEHLVRGRLDRYTMVWRGSANIAWPLDPSLVRKLAGAKERGSLRESDLAGAERELLAEARRLRFDRGTDGTALSDLELLATLQHQGAATRLLDVTLNALVAAWFVVEDETQQAHDGALFAIDVTDRPLPAERVRRPIGEAVDGSGTWLWRPPPLDQRMRAQQAAFLLSAVPDPITPQTSLDLEFKQQNAARLFDDTPGQGRFAKRAVVIFRVPPRVKRQLRDFLTRRLGFDVETLYPDLAGFARARRA